MRFLALIAAGCVCGALAHSALAPRLHPGRDTLQRLSGTVVERGPDALTLMGDRELPEAPSEPVRIATDGDTRWIRLTYETENGVIVRQRAAEAPSAAPANGDRAVALCETKHGALYAPVIIIVHTAS